MDLRSSPADNWIKDLQLPAVVNPPAAPQAEPGFEQNLSRELALMMENVSLLKQIQESQRQNEAQKKFLAMVAHDVQNPLTAILAYAEILGQRLWKLPTASKYTSNIRSAAAMLNRLITDLVDLAAIESGKLRVNMKVMNLAAVAKEVASRMAIVARKKKIKFSVNLPPAVPPLMGDPSRLDQVLQNLCANAIQYTPKNGKVDMEIKVTSRWIVVSVSDSGIGISKEELPRIFERNFQGCDAQKMRQAGFGLGLEISREIVQGHGGQIGVESKLGKGSRFFFKLPIKKLIEQEI